MTPTRFRSLLIVFLVLSCALPALSKPARASNPQEETNLALNKRVTVSSSYDQGSWGAALAVDGERNENRGARGWSSEADKSDNHTEWIQIDLGGNHPINRVDIYPRNDPARLGEGFPLDFTIEVSKDGRSWSAVVRKTGYRKPGDEVQRFAFNPVGGRYVRIVGTNLRYLGAEQAYYMQFAEVEVYAGSTASPGPSGQAVLAGTSWQGEIRLEDGTARELTIEIDKANIVSGEIVASGGRANTTRLTLQGTYDPGNGAFSLRCSGRDGLAAAQGTLTGTALSPTSASGQIALTIMQPANRRTVNGTWQIER